MFRVDAQAVIAFMPDDHSFRDGAVVFHIDEPVQPDGGVGRDVDYGVPVLVQGM